MPKKLLIFIFSFFILLFNLQKPLEVSAFTCSINIFPTVVKYGITTNIGVTVTNNGPEVVNEIVIENTDILIYTINGGSASGWEASFNESLITFSGNSIASGGSANFIFSINALRELGIASVIVDAGSEGSQSVECEGVDITTGQVVEISNLAASVSSTTANISWTTSLPANGTLNYGLTSGYGTSVNTANGTSHTISLTGLTPSTTYHYKVSSLDSTSNVITSDLTFTTGAIGVTTTVTNTVTNTTTNTVNVTKILTDQTPPTIRYKTEFKKIYEEAPLVEIVSNDGTGIARIEYSTDGGVNFSPIDIGDNFGDKQITSEFTPYITEDGDYTLIIKTTDTTGNKIQSKEVKFTIDRLPPRVGPLTVMAGPLIINSNSSGKIELLIGVEYKFILTSAGGPNKISMSCNENSYDFFKNNDIGVWTAKVKFDKSGECAPEITAEDGAGNVQTINSEELIVNNLGKLQNGTIIVYWYDDFERKFVVWDALPYGQINPINTNEAGGYSVLLPAGKYYLEAWAIGKRTSVSNIIDTSETVYINDDWSLSPGWKFWQLRQEKQINTKKLGNNNWQEVNFPLPKVNLGNLSTLDIRGKTTISSLLSSWHPTTNSYLKTIDELFKNKITVYPVLIQEKDVQAKTLKRRGGYELNIYADSDGQLLKDISSSGLPTTWIVNRFGQVVKSKVGEITYDEVFKELNSID